MASISPLANKVAFREEQFDVEQQSHRKIFYFLLSPFLSLIIAITNSPKIPETL